MIRTLIVGVLLGFGILFVNPVCKKETQKVSFTHFTFIIPHDFVFSVKNKTAVLINGKDTLRMKEGWNQEWQFKYDILYFAYQQNPKGFIKSHPTQTDSLPSSYYGHRIRYRHIENLFLREAYPARLGLTDIHLENTLTNWSLRLYGKNLSQETIKKALQIAASVQYEDKNSMKILSVKMDDCAGPAIEVIGQDSVTGKYLYETYPKMTIEPQLDGKCLVRLETQYPCCTVRGITMKVTGNKIRFMAERIKSSELTYSVDQHGIHFVVGECRCTCIYCHNLIIEGIPNTASYQYFFQDEPLLPVQSEKSGTFAFQAKR